MRRSLLAVKSEKVRRQPRCPSAQSIEPGRQDFTSYHLIIDARSLREYADDHIAGAANLPVVDNEEYAEVGITHRSDKHRACLIGVAYSLRNMAAAIEDLVAQYPRQARMLVYRFRGGKRSKLWFDTLSTIGYHVERLHGGWKAYRRWVNDQLAVLPARFTYHVLCVRTSGIVTGAFNLGLVARTDRGALESLRSRESSGPFLVSATDLRLIAIRIGHERTDVIRHLVCLSNRPDASRGPMAEVITYKPGAYCQLKLASRERVLISCAQT